MSFASLFLYFFHTRKIYADLMIQCRKATSIKLHCWNIVLYTFSLTYLGLVRCVFKDLIFFQSWIYDVRCVFKFFSNPGFLIHSFKTTDRHPYYFLKKSVVAFQSSNPYT